jgi:hypothetical protein
MFWFENSALKTEKFCQFVVLKDPMHVMHVEKRKISKKKVFIQLVRPIKDRSNEKI